MCASERGSRPSLTYNQVRQHNLQVINDARQNKAQIKVYTDRRPRHATKPRRCSAASSAASSTSAKPSMPTPPRHTTRSRAASATCASRPTTCDDTLVRPRPVHPPHRRSAHRLHRPGRQAVRQIRRQLRVRVRGHPARSLRGGVRQGGQSRARPRSTTPTAGTTRIMCAIAEYWRVQHQQRDASTGCTTAPWCGTTRYPTSCAIRSSR